MITPVLLNILLLVNVPKESVNVPVLPFVKVPLLSNAPHVEKLELLEIVAPDLLLKLLLLIVAPLSLLSIAAVPLSSPLLIVALLVIKPPLLLLSVP